MPKDGFTKQQSMAVVAYMLNYFGDSYDVNSFTRALSDRL